jgi:hypothetical protein
MTTIVKLRSLLARPEVRAALLLAVIVVVTPALLGPEAFAATWHAIDSVLRAAWSMVA